jgi:Na+/H+ antiporter NhaD/arsenite permease-like protein
MSALAAATAADPLLLHPINATAIATLAIFIVTVAAVVGLALRPVTLRLRAPACLRLSRPIVIPLRAWGAPPAGALCMLAAGALNGPSIAAGLRGDGDIQPYTILVLFLSLAYAALALDQTGALAWLALRLTRAARSGHALLALHTALAGGITLLTSNDVVVMSLTPIVYVQAAAGGAEPTPYLAAEFVAANLYSMALFIGNPTNLIAAQAFNLSFLECAF